MEGLVKKGLLGIILFLNMSTELIAQERREHYQRIEAIKVAFITKKLDLTTEEAQKFWPVYNNYQKELMVLMRKRREDRQKTDIDPNEKINVDLTYESRMLDLKKKYKKLYLKVIAAEKVLLLYQAEREFREHLIKQLKDRRRD
jgi:hypothetical protein